MIFLLKWIGSGLIGYWLILMAYKRLEGYVTLGRCIQQSIAILTGPVAVIWAAILHFDLMCDPPKREKNEQNWMNKKVL